MKNQNFVTSLIKVKYQQKNDYLSSNQEEADTRIILHVLTENNFGNTILVKSVDTDVLLLLIYYYSVTSEMAKCNVFLQFGQSKNKHFLSINNIVTNLGEEVCKKLLSIHCLTGCDKTCSLFKIDKKQHSTFYTKTSII